MWCFEFWYQQKATDGEGAVKCQGQRGGNDGSWVMEKWGRWGRGEVRWGERRGVEQVDSWCCRSQGGRQAENSWAGTMSLSADCRLTKHTGHVDTKTQTQTKADHYANIQTAREWERSHNLNYMQPRNATNVTQITCVKRSQDHMLHQVHPPIKMSHRLHCMMHACICVWMFVKSNFWSL